MTLFTASPAGATISSCGRYRYSLFRRWNDDAPTSVWIMLNPSTADGTLDDPTIRRVVGYAKAWGDGGIIVVNLFGLRATSPKKIREPGDPIGAGNDGHLQKLFAYDRRIIAAWGRDGCYLDRDLEVMRLLGGRTVECLGITKDGHPWHPLYLPANLRPIPFNVRQP